MTESLPPSSENERQKDLNEAAPRKSGSFLSYVAHYVLVILVALAVSVFWQVAQPVGTRRMDAIESLAPRLTALETRVAKIEAKLDLVKVAPVAEGAGVAPALPETGDIEKLKSGLAELSSTLGSLQTQMEKSAETAHAVEAKADAGPATVIAYVRLERAARFGQPFEKERQSLRRLAGGDAELVEQLMKLEPVALKGVANLETLRADWRELEPQALSALRKAGAKTWQDRLLVALQDLISIRSIDDKARRPLSMEEIEIDLAHGDLAGVLQKTALFPPEVQTGLKAWRAQVEARKDLDAALDDVAMRLIAHGESAVGEAAPAAPEPELPAIAMPELAAPASAAMPPAAEKR